MMEVTSFFMRRPGQAYDRLARAAFAIRKNIKRELLFFLSRPVYGQEPKGPQSGKMNTPELDDTTS
jgi:hypothetical protein